MSKRRPFSIGRILALVAGLILLFAPAVAVGTEGGDDLSEFETFQECFGTDQFGGS